jgi:hypothetical protein
MPEQGDEVISSLSSIVLSVRPGAPLPPGTRRPTGRISRRSRSPPEIASAPCLDADGQETFLHLDRGAWAHRARPANGDASGSEDDLVLAALGVTRRRERDVRFRSRLTAQLGCAPPVASVGVFETTGGGD